MRFNFSHSHLANKFIQPVAKDRMWCCDGSNVLTKETLHQLTRSPLIAFKLFLQTWSPPATNSNTQLSKMFGASNENDSEVGRKVKDFVVVCRSVHLWFAKRFYVHRLDFSLHHQTLHAFNVTFTSPRVDDDSIIFFHLLNRRRWHGKQHRASTEWDDWEPRRQKLFNRLASQSILRTDAKSFQGGFIYASPAVMTIRWIPKLMNKSLRKTRSWNCFPIRPLASTY